MMGEIMQHAHANRSWVAGLTPQVFRIDVLASLRPHRGTSMRSRILT
jgi:hypothetical protein